MGMMTNQSPVWQAKGPSRHWRASHIGDIGFGLGQTRHTRDSTRHPHHMAHVHHHLGAQFLNPPLRLGLKPYSYLETYLPWSRGELPWRQPTPETTCWVREALVSSGHGTILSG